MRLTFEYLIHYTANCKLNGKEVRCESELNENYMKAPQDQGGYGLDDTPYNALFALDYRKICEQILIEFNRESEDTVVAILKQAYKDAGLQEEIAEVTARLVRKAILDMGLVPATDFLKRAFDGIGVNIDHAKEVIKESPNNGCPEEESAAPMDHRAMISRMSWTGDGCHVRWTDPKEPEPKADTQEIWLHGQGFRMENFEVKFVSPSGQTPPATVIEDSLICDIDVFQKVKVKVALSEAGMWKVSASATDFPETEAHCFKVSER